MRRRDFLPLAFAGALGAQSDERHRDLLDRLALPQAPIDVVLDTDARNEIDDPFAIAHALLSPGRIRVEALYAGPFVNSRAKTPGQGMEQSYDEILRVLRLLGRDASPGFVLRGSETYLTGAPEPPVSEAADDLIRRAHQARERPLYAVVLGCPTNVSAALSIDPSIKAKIVVVWIGGQPYSSRSADDYNIGQDYEASRELFDSGVPLIDVPGYWVSEMMRTTRAELETALHGKSPIADYLLESFIEYEARSAEPGVAYSKPIWDLAVTGFLVDPAWVPTRIETSPILTPRMTWAIDPSRHPVRVATRVDRDRIFADLFRKLAAA